MIKVLIFIATCVLLFACNQNKETTPSKTPSSITTDTVDNFFPVTSFLKGEIYQIKNAGTTPLRKITINKKTDSTWVKMEQLDSLLAIFTNPVIDTANCKNTFEEKKFLDQTINAFTFTYEPKAGIQNTFAFSKWDVYVNPETQKVTRIYLVKKDVKNVMFQLTWVVGKYCKIVTLRDTTGNNNLVIEKEETITWAFD